MSASKITKLLLKYRPPASWIVNESGLPYLRLDITVPTQLIWQEWQQVKHMAVDHRSTDIYASESNKGWRSLVLHGTDSTETEAIADNMGWTEIANLCPYTVNWIKETFIVDQTTGRIRFMLLEPNGQIVLHKDRNSKRLCEINVAITQPENCEFRFKNYGAVPFTAGKAFMVDISNEHFLYNYSDQPRLHMILHTKISPATIVKSYENRFYN